MSTQSIPTIAMEFDGTGFVPKKSRGEPTKFVRSPPLEWMTIAARLPGKALHVATAIRYIAGLKRKRAVAWEPNKLAMFGLTRPTLYRGLQQLEAAGLITVDRHRGRAARITIVETGDGPTAKP